MKVQGHTIRWFAVVPGTGERIRRNSFMAEKDWGWDATCSCGWDSRTGGALAVRIEENIEDHKRDVATPAELDAAEQAWWDKRGLVRPKA